MLCLCFVGAYFISPRFSAFGSVFVTRLCVQTRFLEQQQQKRNVLSNISTEIENPKQKKAKPRGHLLVLSLSLSPLFHSRFRCDFFFFFPSPFLPFACLCLFVFFFNITQCLIQLLLVGCCLPFPASLSVCQCLFLLAFRVLFLFHSHLLGWGKRLVATKPFCLSFC